jgi:TctA family transporter
VVGYVLRLCEDVIAAGGAGRRLGAVNRVMYGDPSVFVTRPISAALLAITVAVLVAPAVVRLVRARR